MSTRNAGAGEHPFAGDGFRDELRRYYAARLEQAGGCCGVASAEAEASPGLDGSPSFGCGEPTLIAHLREGERVLDLGSGAGLDAFRAAGAVGPGGRVIGVDMTPAMLDRARAGARRLGIDNVDFLEGLIEALPLPDETVDVVLSNCVVNLAADKRAVFSEAFRVLRPGGRLAISDVLRNGERLEPATVGGWCACVDGAEAPASYRRYLRDAGFVEVAVGEPAVGLPSGATYSAVVRAARPDVRAAAPEDLPGIRGLLGAAGLPTAGLGGQAIQLFVVAGPARGGLPPGVVGFERHGDTVLLRSLAVRRDARGGGLGVGLIRHAQARARATGARTVIALTTTIPGLLTRLGFTSVERAALPTEILARPEIEAGCPASAAVFVLPLR